MAFTVYTPVSWDIGPVARLEYLTGRWTIQTLTDGEETERRLAREQYEAAELRATTLLLTYLSPEQAKQYRQKGCFDLIGSLGGRYRIKPGYAYNVHRLRDGGEVTALCGGPTDLPRSDVMLAQYLALAADEAGFLSVANACDCRVCRSGYCDPL